MDDALLLTLLNKTGKERFVDFLPYCSADGKTQDIIDSIRADQEYGYTLKSYQTRVHNIKTIIRADRVSDALLYIAERKRLDESVKDKALYLLEGAVSNDMIVASVDGKRFENGYTGEDRMAFVNVRLGQNRFRKDLIDEWGGCSITSYNDVSMLVASHIKPWKKSSPEEKVDSNNGLLLLPNLDKLFDKGYITFDENGRLLISSQLHRPEIFSLPSNYILPLNAKRKKYMQFHRASVFKS